MSSNPYRDPAAGPTPFHAAVADSLREFLLGFAEAVAEQAKPASPPPAPTRVLPPEDDTFRQIEEALRQVLPRNLKIATRVNSDRLDNDIAVFRQGKLLLERRLAVRTLWDRGETIAFLRQFYNDVLEADNIAEMFDE